MNKSVLKDTNNQKRINFDVPEEMHKKIKMFATERGISIKKWILRTLINEIIKLNGYK